MDTWVVALRCMFHSLAPTFRPLRAAMARFATLLMFFENFLLHGSSARPLFHRSAVPYIEKTSTGSYLRRRGRDGERRRGKACEARGTHGARQQQ